MSIRIVAKPNMKNKILVALATIILGAIGSGLWEIAVKPSLSWTAEAGLYVATLGMTSLRDQIYIDIARGYYERTSLVLLSCAMGFIFAVVTIAIARALKTIRFSQPIRMEPSDGNLKTKKLMILIPVLLFFLSWLTILFARNNYIVLSVTHANQMLAICAPYMNQQENSLIRSELSQVKSRDDFKSVMGKLDKIALEHNLKTPDFSIF